MFRGTFPRGGGGFMMSETRERRLRDGRWQPGRRVGHTTT
jgi:hypothetical protein